MFIFLKHIKNMKTGDSVYCIDDDFSMYPNVSFIFKELPIKGEIYTIRDLRPMGEDLYSVLLSEIINPEVFIEAIGGLMEPRFNANRFVPLKPNEVMSLMAVQAA